MSCSRGCCASFKEHLQGVSFGASTMPSRRAAVNEIERKDKEWGVDAPAYKRLRQQDYQPPDIEGSAALEAKANDPMEIEKGKIMSKEKVNAYKTATDQLTEKGLLVCDP